MVKNIKKQNGITLMTIIITIVVLLILLGVAISIAIDKEFIGKAEYADQLNEEAISKAEKDEENALKQNAESFQVKEEYDVSEILPYEYVETKNGNEQTIHELRTIEYSLSKYIKDNNGSGTIYFKMNTNKENLYYTAKIGEGNENIGTLYNEYYKMDTQEQLILEREDDETKNSDNKTENDIQIEKQENLGYIYTNTLIKVELSTLDDLKISAYKNKIDAETTAVNVDPLAQLTYKHENNDNIIYIPVEETPEIYIDLDENSNKKKVFLKSNRVGIKDLANAEDGAVISEKTTISVGEMKKNGVNNYMIEKQSQSTIQRDSENKIANREDVIYLVQEKTDKFDKTITMTDCKFEFYVPITEIKITSPKNLNYIQSEKLIITEYYGENEKIADVDESTLIISIPEDGNAYLENLKKAWDKADDDTINGSNNNTWNGHFEISDKKIYSVNTDIPEVEETITDTIKIKAYIKDLGGNEKDTVEEIIVASDNFYVFQMVKGEEDPVGIDVNGNDMPAHTGYYNTLDEALRAAKLAKSDKGTPTIKQIVPDYTFKYQDGGDYEKYTSYTDNSIINEYLRTYDCFVIDFDFIYDLNGNNLNFESRHNTLNFKYDFKIRILEGVNFTLKSSSDSDRNVEGHQNGVINIKHINTFEEHATIAHLDSDEMYKIDKYKKYESIEAYLIYLGKETKGFKGIANKLLYLPSLINARAIAYKEYLNSYNVGAIQNIDYKYRGEAVVNEGTFNFESGKISYESEEKVRAFGAWGSGIVLNIADGFLQTIEDLFNIDIANITDYTSSYAKLEHTATGILNFGTVNLGESSARGVTSYLSGPFPEISIKTQSKCIGVGLSVGSIHDPNQALTRTYGVWNATKDYSENSTDDKNNIKPLLKYEKNSGRVYGNTTMNSGFMELLIQNNTNNWVSLNVGRAYGIFNDGGNTTVNGFTKNRIRRDLAIWGLDKITLRDYLVKEYELDENDWVIAKFFKQDLPRKLNEVTDKIENFVKDVAEKTYDGLYIGSVQQIATKMTGGATTCYTNAYAVANANGRKIYRQEEQGDDGIIFGESFDYQEIPFTGKIIDSLKEYDILNIIPQNSDGQNYVSLAGYYVLTPKSNPYTHYDIHDNTYQSIINPLEFYLDFDALTGSVASSGIGALNNLAFSSWIGQDFNDTGTLGSILRLIARSIRQIFD